MLKFRVWHIPQVPARSDKDIFRVEVDCINQAIFVLKTIWVYDIFQFERKIKPDFSNASGLECYDKDAKEWQEYYNDEGNDISAIIKEREEN